MKVLIVEDEDRIAKRIERMTRDFFGSALESLKVVDSLTNGIDYIAKTKLDLVLLDLNLNGKDGFEMLKTAVAEPFDTIIVSAQREYALKAFEFGVLDFVPKPFNRVRLDQAFQRIMSKDKRYKNSVRFLAVKKRGSISLVNVEDVIYIKGAGVYTELVFTNGECKLHDKSLEKLEQLLPETFERVHKSYLVKMTECNKIVINPGSKYEIELKNGCLLPVGRTKYKRLKEKWF